MYVLSVEKTDNSKEAAPKELPVLLRGAETHWSHNADWA